MHILLTDILVCPRCGPPFGLILLADRIEQRRVLEGRLGCANCRETYIVQHGAVDFGGAPRIPAEPADPHEAVRLAALLGLTQGSAFALLAGPAAAQAPALTRLLEGTEFIALTGEAGAAAERETPGISHIGAGAKLPFANQRLAGVALTGVFAASHLDEGARVLSPLGRLLLEPAPPDAAERLRELGLKVVAHEQDTLIAARA